MTSPHSSSESDTNADLDLNDVALRDNFASDLTTFFAQVLAPADIDPFAIQEFSSLPINPALNAYLLQQQQLQQNLLQQNLLQQRQQQQQQQPMPMSMSISTAASASAQQPQPPATHAASSSFTAYRNASDSKTPAATPMNTSSSSPATFVFTTHPIPPAPSQKRFQNEFHVGVSGSTSSKPFAQMSSQAGDSSSERDSKPKYSHIASEQKRRDNIKEGFNMLKEVVPQVREGASRAVILKKSAEYIDLLKKQNKQLANRLQGSAESEEISFDALVEAISKRLHIKAHLGEGALKLMYKDEGRLMVDITSQEDLDDLFRKHAASPDEYVKVNLLIKKPSILPTSSKPPVAEDIEQLVLANDAVVSEGVDISASKRKDSKTNVAVASTLATTFAQGASQNADSLMRFNSFVMSPGQMTFPPSPGAMDGGDDDNNDDEDDARIAEDEDLDEENNDRPPDLPLDMDLNAVTSLHMLLAGNPGMTAGCSRMSLIDWQQAKVYRFLVACKGNAPLAKKMLEAHFDWLLSYHPERITEGDCKNELRCNKLYWHGRDLAQRPCLIFKASRHSVSKRDKYETIRHWIYLVEDFLEHRASHPFQQFVFIYDRSNATRNNSDVPMLKKFVRIFQQNYPELLHCMYVVRADFVFKYGYSVVRRFTSKSFRKKIKLLGDDWQERLLQDFTPDNLQVEYGGTSTYIYEYKEGDMAARQTGLGE